MDRKDVIAAYCASNCRAKCPDGSACLEAENHALWVENRELKQALDKQIKDFNYTIELLARQKQKLDAVSAQYNAVVEQNRSLQAQVLGMLEDSLQSALGQAVAV